MFKELCRTLDTCSETHGTGLCDPDAIGVARVLRLGGQM